VQVNTARPGIIGVRDSKPAASAVLLFGPLPWRTFLADARSGRFHNGVTSDFPVI
jgi:hypothetical protein